MVSGHMNLVYSGIYHWQIYKNHIFRSVTYQFIPHYQNVNIAGHAIMIDKTGAEHILGNVNNTQHPIGIQFQPSYSSKMIYYIAHTVATKIPIGKGDMKKGMDTPFFSIRFKMISSRNNSTKST